VYVTVCILESFISSKRRCEAGQEYNSRILTTLKRSEQ